MAFAPLKWVEEHPYTSAGIAAVVLIGGVLIVSSGGSSAGNNGSGSDTSGLVDAELQAQNQQAATQAQLSGAAQQINGQITINGQNVAAQEQANQLAAYTTETGQAYQLQQTSATIDGQVAVANLSAQVANLQTTTAGQVSEAATQAQVDIQNLIDQSSDFTTQQNDATTLGIAAINGQTQQLISTNQAQVGITQANDIATVGVAQGQDAVAIAKVSGGNSTGSILSGVGAIAGALL